MQKFTGSAYNKQKWTFESHVIYYKLQLKEEYIQKIVIINIWHVIQILLLVPMLLLPCWRYYSGWLFRIFLKEGASSKVVEFKVSSWLSSAFFSTSTQSYTWEVNH